MDIAFSAKVGVTGEVLKRSLLVALFCVVFTLPPQAAEPEEGAGFFEYLPAVPEIKLPKSIDIPFWTSDLKKARRAYRDADYGRALKFFRRESQDGNMVADWYLAHMYRLGQGVPRDHSVAYSYYSRVAESYDPDETDNKRLRIVIDSQVRLATYRRIGIPQAGMKADPAMAAREYLQIASTYGHPAAQFALGEMNIEGEGIKQNPQQGLKWITAAARKRHAEAAAYLGDLYWSGEYVKRSQTRALMWYTLAVQTAVPEENAGIFSRYDELMTKVDEDTKLEAEARARVWAEQFPATKDN